MLTRDRKSGNEEAKREKIEIYTGLELVYQSQTKTLPPERAIFP